MLKPCQSKHADCIRNNLVEIFLDYGSPKIIQCDNGKEFEGSVKRFLEKRKVRKICGRPYHPQSQGKVERSHRTLKSKLR